MKQGFVKVCVIALVPSLMGIMAYGMRSDRPDLQELGYAIDLQGDSHITCFAQAEQNFFDDGQREEKDAEQKAHAAGAADETMSCILVGEYYFSVSDMKMLKLGTLWQFLPKATQHKLRGLYDVRWLEDASRYLADRNNPAGRALLEHLQQEAEQEEGNRAQKKACQVAYLAEFIKRLPPASTFWNLLSLENRGLLESAYCTQELFDMTKALWRANHPSYSQILLQHLLGDEDRDRDDMEINYVLAMIKVKNKQVDECAADIKKTRENRIPRAIWIAGYIFLTGMLTGPIISAGLCS